MTFGRSKSVLVKLAGLMRAFGANTSNSTLSANPKTNDQRMMKSKVFENQNGVARKIHATN